MKNIIPPNQILFAFIAGSRANGDYTLNSDIDLFIVINEPDYEKEKELAEALKVLHLKYNLYFDHCGEIFSRTTIENLLANIDNVDKVVKLGFCKLACFQTQCILSIIRKTLVILTMLSHKKTHIIGDKTLLAKYEKAAINFFASNSQISLSTSNQKITWPIQNEKVAQIMDKHQDYMHKLELMELLDTPVGISLERFFLRETKQSDEKYDALAIISTNNLNLPENLCPIDNIDLAPMKSLIKSQCIGFI